MAANLFEKYGGFASISKIVLAFYDRALESDILAPYFDGVDMKRLIDHQTKFISSVMGGPASYSNEALRDVHAHLQIGREAIDEMTGLLEETLEDFDLDEADIAAVMSEIRSRAPYVMAGGRR